MCVLSFLSSSLASGPGARRVEPWLRPLLLLPVLFCSCDTLLTDIVRDAFSQDRSNSTYFDQNHPDHDGELPPLPQDAG